MAHEEGFAATEEPHTEQQHGRGREELRTPAPPKRGKSKTMLKDPMEARISLLEGSLTAVNSLVGELSDQVDNLIAENAEIAKAAKVMICECSQSFEGQIEALNENLADLRKYVECEIHDIRREMETFRRHSPQSVGNAWAECY